MLLLLLMLVSQYETHIFLDHDLAKESYPDLLDRDLTKLPIADLLGDHQEVDRDRPLPWGKYPF